jgi:hypothetical protein
VRALNKLFYLKSIYLFAGLGLLSDVSLAHFDRKGCIEFVRSALKRPSVDTYTKDRPLKVFVSSGFPRGGFGDVAANLVMAKRIKENLDHKNIPNVVAVLVEGFSESFVEKLIPEYHRESKTAVVWNGVMIASHQVVPHSKADIGFGFSMLDETHQALRMTVHSNPVFLFKEPFSSNPLEREMALTNRIVDKREGISLHVGADSLGLYLSSPGVTAVPKFSKNELIQRFELPANTRIAFSYSHFSYATAAYLQILAQLLESDTTTPVVLFTKGYSHLSFDLLPKNVIVRADTPLSLDESESLIAHADFPVLVTGDTSLALAIEHGTPFIYEMVPWKDIHTLRIYESLAAHADKFAFDQSTPAQIAEFKDLMSKLLFTIPGRDVRLPLKPVQQTTHQDIVKFFKNPKFVEYFKFVMQKFKNQASLTEAVEAFIF